jgi:hypothetical protein
MSAENAAYRHVGYEWQAEYDQHRDSHLEAGMIFQTLNGKHTTVAFCSCGRGFASSASEEALNRRDAHAHHELGTVMASRRGVIPRADQP